MNKTDMSWGRSLALGWICPVCMRVYGEYTRMCPSSGHGDRPEDGTDSGTDSGVESGRTGEKDPLPMEPGKKEKGITERIETFCDAYIALRDKDHPLIDNYNQWADNVEDNDPQLRAALQLRIIVAALNDGWKPEFTMNEEKYYPCFKLLTQEDIDKMDEKERHDVVSMTGYNTMYAGFAFQCVKSVCSSFIYHTEAPPYFGLILKSEELARYCGKQFAYLWRALMFS